VHGYPRVTAPRPAPDDRQRLGVDCVTFLPYPGFVRDPYQSIPSPGSALTRCCARQLCHSAAGSARRVPQFYTPTGDIFAGFRTWPVTVLRSRDNPRVTPLGEAGARFRLRRKERRPSSKAASACRNA